jgi:hypothetical protein
MNDERRKKEEGRRKKEEGRRFQVPGCRLKSKTLTLNFGL